MPGEQPAERPRVRLYPYVQPYSTPTSPPLLQGWHGRSQVVAWGAAVPKPTTGPSSTCGMPDPAVFARNLCKPLCNPFAPLVIPLQPLCSHHFAAPLQPLCNPSAAPLQALCDPFAAPLWTLCNPFAIPLQLLCSPWECAWQHRDAGGPRGVGGGIPNRISQWQSRRQTCRRILSPPGWDAPGTQPAPSHCPRAARLPFASLPQDREHV